MQETTTDGTILVVHSGDLGGGLVGGFTLGLTGLEYAFSQDINFRGKPVFVKGRGNFMNLLSVQHGCQNIFFRRFFSDMVLEINILIKKDINTLVQV